MSQEYTTAADGTPFPYLPEGRTIQYVTDKNPFMRQARDFLFENRGDLTYPTSGVVVRDDEVLCSWSNCLGAHKDGTCERQKQHVPTGTRYDLCSGCGHDNHSERGSMIRAKKEGIDVKGADFYLYGHWWCCEPCWEAMIEGGIRNVYLLENSEVLFNKEHPDNVLGRHEVLLAK